jgi:DNA polymerase III epsilon subunit-like protein
VPVSTGYALFDCETTGTDPEADEIVELRDPAVHT